ncbi:MAG: amidohydrolase [Christensenellaceae bacterium]|nr:amidohydrolase [Christensenellaceae bacterium]
MDYQHIIDAVMDKKEELNSIALKMYEHPETAYNEVMAKGWLSEALLKYGFKVETGLYGMPTSIRAEWGSGHPVIGLLAEYDALPGLSQTQNTYKDPAVKDGPGQGCGHNLLGTATLAAAIGIKADLEKSGFPGTVVFYGCPAEEVLTGKPFMARGGAFRELDIALAWHGNSKNTVELGMGGGLNSAVFHFRGKTAHASAAWNGRSALDAVELMNIGANYLREHMTPNSRIHYVYKEAGVAPNIVPDRASVWYYVRSLKRRDIDELYGRLVDVAKGAALMTGTELEIEFMGGCYNTMSNKVLADLFAEVYPMVPKPEYTKEELETADALNRSVAAFETEKPEEPIHTGFIYEPEKYSISPGSSDVGDVQHIVPGMMIGTASQNILGVNHTWQTTCCAGNGIGLKGMLRGGIWMALGAARILRDNELVKKAWETFKKDLDGETYECPIPDDVPVPQPKL